MIKIMPQTLPQKARAMVRCAYYNSPATEKTMTSFFTHANKENLQGPALTSYYSAISEISKEGSDDVFKIVKKNIFNKIENNEELKKLANEFAKKLNKTYPKTLGDRISILSNEAVVEGEVKPISKFKRFFVVLSKAIREA